MTVPGVPKGTVSPRCKSAYVSRILIHPAPRPPGIAPALLTEPGLLPSPSAILYQTLVFPTSASS